MDCVHTLLNLQHVLILHAAFFMETFAQKVINFHRQLELNQTLQEVEVMNPFKKPEVMGLVEQFFLKYFSDHNSRSFLFGINPGRHGAGITGISFTDPVNLEEKCGIKNDFDKKHELSSLFIYQVIEAYGGPEKFYKSFFVTAISPLGFTKNGININYYDEKPLQQSLEPFINETMLKQVALGARRKCAICIGGGKNYKFMKQLNDSLKIFEEIIPLDHPRFIMQYRRKVVGEYVKKYLDALNYCESQNLS